MNNLLEALQPYIVAAILAVVGSVALLARKALNLLVMRGNAWLDAHTTAAQRQTIKAIAGEAWAHAETAYKDQGGKVKLDAAIGYALTRLNGYGIKVSNTDIKAAVHEAWLTNDKQAKSGQG